MYFKQKHLADFVSLVRVIKTVALVINRLRCH